MCDSVGDRIGAGMFTRHVVSSKGEIILPIASNREKRVLPCSVASASRLGTNDCNVVRPGLEFARSNAIGTISGSRVSVIVMPNVIFSVFNSEVNCNKKCCSGFLRSFGNVGINIACDRYVYCDMPTRRGSMGVSVLVARTKYRGLKRRV